MDDAQEPEPTQAAPLPPGPDAPELTSALREEMPGTELVAPPQPRDPGTEGAPSESDQTSGPMTDTGAGLTASWRSASRGRPSSRRGGLGAGLVEVPPVPARAPADAVMAHPVVAESKRFCSNCNAKVGRGGDGQPGPTEGTCAACGTAFSFRPRLSAGETIGGQYEVLGAVAYGGLGWIYLAQDHNVADRWVVLKGLIDTGDATAMEAAVNETRFLAEVEHPNIVKIFNFVEHPDPATGTTVGYIVMEYIGGQSLRQLALAHHRALGRPEGMPLPQVLAYGLEILPALGYLHSQGLLYCDLKPDNVIQTHEQLKLIDLGAVRRMDDYASPLFFTSGYSAPELPTQGASVASDLFTVGRTLAVLSFEFSAYTSTYKVALPPASKVPLFGEQESYYRLLRRATHAEPVRRFASAMEMADQLTGVLREVVAATSGEPQPGTSVVFGAEISAFGVDCVVELHGGGAGRVPAPPVAEVIAGLPVPMVDTEDAAAGLLATTATADPRVVIEALAKAPHDSTEVRLRVVRARVELDEIAEANRQLQAAQYIAVKSGYPHDWRLEWYRGLIELAAGRPKLAYTAFDAVYDELPGELAPKLGLAVAMELMGDPDKAAHFYETVWHTDQSYVSAAFGLARTYLTKGEHDDAAAVLESVPVTSTHHTAAEVAAIKMRTRRVPSPAGTAGKQVSAADIRQAAARLERMHLDAERRAQLSADVLEAAYACLGRSGNGNGSAAAGEVLGCQFTDRGLRFGLERCYRALARLADSKAERIKLVDQANAIRPRTRT